MLGRFACNEDYAVGYIGLLTRKLAGRLSHIVHVWVDLRGIGQMKERPLALRLSPPLNRHSFIRVVTQIVWDSGCLMSVKNAFISPYRVVAHRLERLCTCNRRQWREEIIIVCPAPLRKTQGQLDVFSFNKRVCNDFLRAPFSGRRLPAPPTCESLSGRFPG